MSSTTDSIIKKLEENAKEDGALPELLDFYKKLIIIQQDIEREVTIPGRSFPTEAIIDHSIKGKPLLEFNNFNIDWELLERSFERLLSLFHEYQQIFSSLPEEIRRLETRQIVNKRTIRAWYKGQKLPLNIKISDATEILLKNIIHASFTPFLRKEAAALCDLIDGERWRRGYCPICGGSPDFGYLKRENSARYLICNRCDSEWLFQRLQCPYCDNKDQNKLQYYTDEKGVYRLYVCDNCKRYLKAIDQRQVEETVLLPLERFMTIDMDRQALEKGYQPGVI